MNAFKKQSHYGNSVGLVVLATKILCRLKASCAEEMVKNSKSSICQAYGAVDERGNTIKPEFIKNSKMSPYWDSRPNKYWSFLEWHGDIRYPSALLAAASVDMYELSGEDKYRQYAEHLLRLQGTKGYIKWIEPYRKKDIPKGYEILANLISGLNTAAWLRSYWQLEAIKKRKR